MSIYTHQDSNIRKTWLLMLAFFAVVIGLGWFFSYIYQSPAILIFAVVLSIVMNITSYWYSDKIVLGMYRAQPVTQKEPGIAATTAGNPAGHDLWNIVENLSITAGLPMPKLYIINDPQPNAFATGRNKEHAAVVVTSGLLGMLNRTELEGVIAHELAHVGNRDMLLSSVVVVLVGLITLLSDFFIRSRMFSGFGGHRGGGDNDRGQAQGVLMIVGIVLAILSPIIATIIQLAISRKREFLADASGALLTRYPEGLASALEKIAAYSARSTAMPMRHANNATAHLFISNPFGLRAAAGVSKLFMTHPPIEERIKILRGMEK